MSDVVIRVENISKLYRLGEVGTGSLAHDVNRWWHKVRGKEDPYLKIGEVNDRTKAATGAKTAKRKLTTEDTESTEGGAGGNQRSDSAEFLEGHSQAGLQMDSEKLASIRSANDSRASGDRSTLDSGLSTPPASVLIRDIRGKKSSSEALDSRPSTLVSAPQAQSDWVYALKDVSFEVKRGEVLGIIGRNGAGKSTLLKILSRVTTQSSGQIKVRGRIASLLEVGTGFHPELTGRENIFLNGAILGMRKAEIARKFDEIVEFSGCARYIDTPVKRYSSGMYVRLAFAVAAHLEPEILIVDEVLAVGDAEFQKKCLGKMKDVAGHGRTVLFVSHNMGAVLSLCDNAISFNNGRLIENGDVRIVVDKYLLNNEKKNIKIVNISKINRAGYFGAKLLLDKIEWESLPLKHGEPASASIYFTVFEDVLNASIGMSFCTPEGTRLLTIDSDFQGESRKNIKKGFHKVNFNIPTICTSPGIYSIEIGARSSDSFMLDYVSDCCQVEVFIGKNSPNYISSHGIGIRLPSQWNWELKG